jgi:hypothetical protein
MPFMTGTRLGFLAQLYQLRFPDTIALPRRCEARLTMAAFGLCPLGAEDTPSGVRAVGLDFTLPIHFRGMTSVAQQRVRRVGAA